MKLSDVFGKLLLLTVVLALAGLLMWDHFVRTPKSKEVEKLLVKEFRSVKLLPQAVPIGYRTWGEGGRASAGESYKTKLKYREIRSHYDSELKRNGWGFHKEKKLLDWGEDFGGMTLTFCKGSYKAELDYAGDQVDYDWTYDFRMNWGDESVVELFTGEYCK